MLAGCRSVVFGSLGDYRVRLSDSAALVASFFQAFIGDFRPQILQRRGACLVRVFFRVVRCPWHSELPRLQKGGLFREL